MMKIRVAAFIFVVFTLLYYLSVLTLVQLVQKRKKCMMQDLQMSCFVRPTVQNLQLFILRWHKTEESSKSSHRRSWIQRMFRMLGDVLIDSFSVSPLIYQSANCFSAKIKHGFSFLTLSKCWCNLQNRHFDILMKNVIWTACILQTKLLKYNRWTLVGVTVSYLAIAFSS